MGKVITSFSSLLPAMAMGKEVTSEVEKLEVTCEVEKLICEIPVSIVEAWYFNPCDEDPKLPHKYTPNRPVAREHLDELGMRIWRLDADNWENNELLERIKKERGYNYWDVVTMAPNMIDYDSKVKHFFTEHLHADEEIRFLLEGGGYWDIRDYDEKWIRFRIQKGDLVVLPPGMYHRFTLDTENHVKAMRLFKGLPCWTQHERPADDMDARKLYVQNVLKSPHVVPSTISAK